MPDDRTIDLADHWARIQRRMALELEDARHQTHHGSGGDASEYDWAKWLGHYLPNRYSVLKDACVIDSLGNRSDQLDVVIYDRHFTPHVWVHEEKIWLPAESVYAVLECKAGLDRAHVDAAGNKVASVRRMERKSKLHVDNSGKVREKAEPKPMLGILVADRSDWALPLGKPLTDALASLQPLGRLDLICAVGAAGVSIAWGEEGSPPAVRLAAGDHALIGFFAELVSALQAQGSVAPIDFDTYTTMLDWTEL